MANDRLKGLFLVGLLAVAGMAVIGWVLPGIPKCNSPSSIKQCGTTSCTISSGANFQFCAVTVNFAPGFSTIPKFVTAQWAGFNSGVNHDEKAWPMSSMYFESDAGQTWTNMPAALTELYGDTSGQHETVIESGTILNSALTAMFGVNCIVASTSSTAILRPQVFDGVVWRDLAQNAGFLDINVGPSCAPFATNGNPVVVGPNAINTVAVSTATAFRVVGLNGGGLGDTPKFNEIYLVFYTDILNAPSICIQILQPCPQGTASTNTPLSTTQMVMTATIPFPTPVSGFKVDMNWMAEE